MPWRYPVRFVALVFACTLSSCNSPPHDPAMLPAEKSSTEKMPTALLRQTAREPTATPTSVRPSKEIAGVKIYELESYSKGERNWRSLVIPRNLQRDALIALARALHRSDPTSSFRFFTDDSQYEQFKLWDQSYPDARYSSPESWTRKHYIAMVNKMLVGGGAQWQLEAMEGGINLLPPETQSTTIAVLE